MRSFRFPSVLIAILCVSFSIPGYSIHAGSASKLTLIKAGRLVDVVDGKILNQQGILIEDGRIKEVGPIDTLAANATAAEIIDLSDSTVLPGLIDCHTHIFLQGALGPEFEDQMINESIPFRTIRASAAARTGLMNGFTAMRDLGSCGAMYSDADIKRAIGLGYIDGPRMFVATRAIAPTGAALAGMQLSWELKIPDDIQRVDGVDSLRKTVREQVKFGADWIKYYSDMGFAIKDGGLHSRPAFSQEEAKAIVEEAHRLGHKVAAHAQGIEGIEAALNAGVDSIEHGFGMNEHLIDMMVARGTYWCPTFSGLEYAARTIPAAASYCNTITGLEGKAFELAVKKGVKIVFGTDTGLMPWTENEANEFAYMTKHGILPLQVIQSATIRPAEMLDATDDIGSLRPGRSADIIAVKGDPTSDVAALQHVSFVMSGGRIIRSVRDEAR